jgi:hypothetical protein
VCTRSPAASGPHCILHTDTGPSHALRQTLPPLGCTVHRRTRQLLRVHNRAQQAVHTASSTLTLAHRTRFVKRRTPDPPPRSCSLHRRTRQLLCVHNRAQQAVRTASSTLTLAHRTRFVKRHTPDPPPRSCSLHRRTRQLLRVHAHQQQAVGTAFSTLTHRLQPRWTDSHVLTCSTQLSSSNQSIPNFHRIPRCQRRRALEHPLQNGSTITRKSSVTLCLQ